MTRKSIIFLLATLLAVLLTMVAILSSTAAANTQVSFINVGQGDSALLQDPNGFDVLIDGGKQSAGPTVVAYIRQQGVDDIDVMVVTHADSDHAGGLIDVLNANDIPVQQVLYSGYAGDTNTWYTFATAVANEGLPLTSAQYPQEYDWGSMKAYVLNPVPGLGNPETNNASVVLRVDYGSVRFLFPADVDSTVESAVVARGTPVAAQVLKVGHHGSQYSSSDLFLNAIQPDDAIISVGVNSYGHPSSETIARLQVAGARIWRTDQNGTILIISDGTTYTLQAEFPTATGSVVYLPLIIRSTPVPATPTPTATGAPTVIPTPTATASPTATPTQEVVTTGNVIVVSVFYDGAGSTEPDEYVEIRNDDSRSIQLTNWTLRDNGNHVFTFPTFTITSGQTCRVYTNQAHPESCGFNYSSGSAIWNNSGDCAYLRNSVGTDIDSYCYP
jgi:competence protein ComEC